MRWRAPLIRAFDRYVKRMHVHDKVPGFHHYFSLPQAERSLLQEQKLVRLLKHAAEHVPYYREVLFDVGVAGPNGTIDLSHFADIPILTKQIVRSQFERLTSNDLPRRRWYYNSTGGTTGTPFRCIQDTDYGQMAIAGEYYYREKLGVRLGERVFQLWGSEREIMEGSIGWRAQMTSYLRHNYMLPAFRMTPDDMQRFVALIRAKRPLLLIAYVECAYEMARYIKKHGSDMPPMLGVVTSAGTLLPAMREEIEQTFNSEVFNRYGSREMSNMAFDLPSHEALEVSTYTHVIEVLDQQREHCAVGEEGEIIVTGLENDAMPLIRYQIGDAAAVHSLTQSPVLSTLAMCDVCGHFLDVIVRRDGTLVSPGLFTHAIGSMHYTDRIEKVQIVQEDFDIIRIRLVASGELPEAELAEIESLLKAGMGDDCHIEFEYVDSLPPSQSGKFQHVISHVERM